METWLKNDTLESLLTAVHAALGFDLYWRPSEGLEITKKHIVVASIAKVRKGLAADAKVERKRIAKLVGRLATMQSSSYHAHCAAGRVHAERLFRRRCRAWRGKE